MLSRLVPGVLGEEQSCQDDSFSTGNRLLEFAQYTRPREYRGLCVACVQCIKEVGLEEYVRLQKRNLGERIDRYGYPHFTNMEVGEILRLLREGGEEAGPRAG